MRMLLPSQVFLSPQHQEGTAGWPRPPFQDSHPHLTDHPQPRKSTYMRCETPVSRWNDVGSDKPVG